MRRPIFSSSSWGRRQGGRIVRGRKELRIWDGRRGSVAIRARGVAEVLRDRPCSSEVADDFAGGVGAAGTGEAVAGVRAGTAEEEATDGGFVARPIEDGAHGEELIEGKFAVENVAAGETVGGFEILGRDDLDAFDEARKIRRVSGEGLDDGVAEFLAMSIPVPFLLHAARGSVNQLIG